MFAVRCVNLPQKVTLTGTVTVICFLTRPHLLHQVDMCLIVVAPPELTVHQNHPLQNCVTPIEQGIILHVTKIIYGLLKP